MKLKPQNFRRRYGRWAVIAGASDGLGAEFAWTLARRGLDLILIARRREKLEALRDEITAAHRVQVELAALDLARSDVSSEIAQYVEGKEVGLLVYNAGLSIIGPLMRQPLESLMESIDTNCKGPLALTYLLGQSMIERRRGGIVLMTSLSGFQGTALVATYAATKAFNLVLAEGLWDELRSRGVDVITCAAGPISTPNFIASEPTVRRLSPPALAPRQVAVETIDALANGRGPVIVPGFAYRLSATLVQRILPRGIAVRFLGANLRAMYPRFS